MTLYERYEAILSRDITERLLGNCIGCSKSTRLLILMGFTNYIDMYHKSNTTHFSQQFVTHHIIKSLTNITPTIDMDINTAVDLIFANQPYDPSSYQTLVDYRIGSNGRTNIVYLVDDGNTTRLHHTDSYEHISYDITTKRFYCNYNDMVIYEGDYIKLHSVLTDTTDIIKVEYPRLIKLRYDQLTINQYNIPPKHHKNIDALIDASKYSLLDKLLKKYEIG